jgi:hypothetical protein
VQSLHALRQGALEDDVKGEFVVIGRQSLGLALSGIAELPFLFEEDFFLVGLAATCRSTGGEMPAESVSADHECRIRIYIYIYTR